MEKGYPLIIVFYLDRELMTQNEIMIPFRDHINTVLAEREANAIALFMPTDGNERVECINPIIATEGQNERINDLIETLEKNFDVGQGADDGKNDEPAD